MSFLDVVLEVFNYIQVFEAVFTVFLSFLQTFFNWTEYLF